MPLPVLSSNSDVRPRAVVCSTEGASTGVAETKSGSSLCECERNARCTASAGGRRGGGASSSAWRRSLATRAASVMEATLAMLRMSASSIESAGAACREGAQVSVRVAWLESGD